MENYGNDVYLSMVSWNNTNFIKNETIVNIIVDI